MQTTVTPKFIDEPGPNAKNWKVKGQDDVIFYVPPEIIAHFVRGQPIGVEYIPKDISGTTRNMVQGLVGMAVPPARAGPEAEGQLMGAGGALPHEQPLPAAPLPAPQPQMAAQVPLAQPVSPTPAAGGHYSSPAEKQKAEDIAVTGCVTRKQLDPEEWGRAFKAAVRAWRERFEIGEVPF
jgi:hypothetical protein